MVDILHDTRQTPHGVEHAAALCFEATVPYIFVAERVLVVAPELVRERTPRRRQQHLAWQAA